MATEEELRDLDTIMRVSQDQQRLEHRILNAMVKADHEKIMKELESGVNHNGIEEGAIS